jgi:DNA repair exonuclease SbcCD ATPase subunit
MLLFRKVKWKNFLGTGNTFIEIELNKSKTTVLLGESGSGQSTLLHEIPFGLFNKPFRNISKPNLVNSINGKNCVVEIEFDIGKISYRVVRGVKPNIFEIYKNGNLINQDAASRDYQAFLENEILKFNIKSFKQIVMLGAANFTPFMQLRPHDRRTIIEELLDIEVFSIMNTLLKGKVSEIKTQTEKVEFDLQIIAEKIKLHEKVLNKAKEDKEAKIKANQKKLKERQENIAEIEKENEKYQEEITELQNKISHKQRLESLVAAVLEKITELDRTEKTISKRLSLIQDNSQCPTCTQNIEEEFKKNKTKEERERLSELQEKRDQIKEAANEYNSNLESIQEIETQIANMELEVNKNKNTIVGIKSFIKDLAIETLELKKDKKETIDVDDKTKLEGAQERQIENKTKLTEKKVICDITSDILRDSGVKAKIIKQYLPLINKYTNKFLTYMDFFVTFNIDEEFNEAIKSRGRDDFRYENFSEGEKQRIDLALLFTWRTIARMKNSINTNLLVMDEVFDSYLDMAATENVINLLKSPMFAHANIMVISHKEGIADKFDSVIRFKKDKNFSVKE